MPTQIPQLIGSWKKITRSACSQMYPDTLQLREKGLYYGQANPPGMFTQWDVGTFEVTDAAHIKISTANDSVVSYEFSIAGDVLTFKDANDCEFQYSRV